MMMPLVGPGRPRTTLGVGGKVLSLKVDAADVVTLALFDAPARTALLLRTPRT